jgi:hypothetical protein
MAIEGPVGATVRDCNMAVVTVSVAVPEMPPEVAAMIEDPAAMLLAIPPGPMTATDGSADAQVTDEVTSFDDPSENAPVALN